MRFFKEGPSIPDDLLMARDEGRVVFFCGAGVSRAFADLPDFFGLAEKVIAALKVPKDNPIHKVIDELWQINKRTRVSGLISADHIFGLLERDFLVCDIEEAVAKALKPCENVDLSAHKILLDLATTPEGQVQLVTTNFDRLFEDCHAGLKTFTPPRLPDLSRSEEMNGIVYLHGRATEDYTRADGDGFILSISEFGRAYLSEGWATQFFKNLIEQNYMIVFVGYSADDPPVRYLLEALHKKAGGLKGVYAFQAGVANEAAAKWEHKGVETIPYAEKDKHEALWKTLEAWAERAKDPEKWYHSIIELAKQGPERLQAHERGQVAHLISSSKGAQKFSESQEPPPAEWLCVFDPRRRYARPQLIKRPFVDPFDLYGLDTDIVPETVASDPRWEDAPMPTVSWNIPLRTVPQTAWNAFALNRQDRQNFSDENFSTLWGLKNISNLLPRLSKMGEWIAKVAHQPTTIWWTASQSGLHPDIQQKIQRQLEHSQKWVIPQAWQYLFEAWEAKEAKGRNLRYGWNEWNEWDNLKRMIEKKGWSRVLIRKYVALYRPYLKAEFKDGPKPPEWKEDIKISEMIELSVGYTNFYPYSPEDIPNEWLSLIVKEFRENLEHALYLETKIVNGDWLEDLPNSLISPDLSEMVNSFLSLFKQLTQFDIVSAKQELAAWPINDHTLFNRLRIQVCGDHQLVSTQEFSSIIMELDNHAFWNIYSKYILAVLAQRWRNLYAQTREEIERRLLQGPDKWDGEDDTEFSKRKAWVSLNALYWLMDQGCEFSFDIDAKTQKLKILVPEWDRKEAAEAAKVVENFETIASFSGTDTEYTVLLNEPLDRILTKAFDLRKENVKDPFIGLSAERPVRAFSALTNAAKRNEYQRWAWGTFLSTFLEVKESNKPKSPTLNKPKFLMLIAERISRYPDDAVAEFIRSAADWLRHNSLSLSDHYPETFDKIISKLIQIHRSQPQTSKSAIMRPNKEPDWITEAINSPVGNIARALCNDSRISALKISKGWFAHANNLLSLEGDARRYALVMFAVHMNWFYETDPCWTEAKMLSILDKDDESEAKMLSILDKDDESDQSAIWAGFFRSASDPCSKLYRRMKSNFLIFAKQGRFLHHNHKEVLARIILIGWGSIDGETKERYISKDEMCDVLLKTDDEFRSHILWLLQRNLESKENKENDVSKTWSARLLEFLCDVWPRQKSVKPATVSSLLCSLAFSNVECFPKIAEIILPLLTTIDPHDGIAISNLRKNNIVDLYPQQTLAILYKILPDNVVSWPYDIGTILDQISTADESLRSDKKLRELYRKWNSKL